MSLFSRSAARRRNQAAFSARRPRIGLEQLESRELFSADPLAFQNPFEGHSVACSCPGCMAPVIQSTLGFAAEALTAPSMQTALALSPVGVPILSSLPGAAVSLFLDFDGDFQSSWGSYGSVSTPSYDTDGNASAFSASEQSAMASIWAYVAEDYAPFRVNVTTVEPANLANGQAIKIAIGGNGAWLGSSAGGVAYIDGFTNSAPNVGYAFSSNLGNGYTKYTADAASHEAGHLFGLQHQSKYSATGALLESYSTGAGDGRAPLMGNSYDATRSLWWSGTTTSAGTRQDDMTTLARAANGFGYRSDDHANTAAAATAVAVSNNSFSGAGVLHSVVDTDYFAFTTGAGQITLSVDVPAANNLDARLELRDALGTLIVSAAPTTSFGATLGATVAAGSYRLVVTSNGLYGDVGQYTVRGQVAPAVTSVNAPANLTASANASGQVNLRWADNASNEAGFHVERSENGGAWVRVASLGGNATAHTDSAPAGATIQYRVQAYNGSVVSTFSNVAAVTLAPAAPANLSATATSGTRVELTWSNVAAESGYKVERTSGGAWVQIGAVASDVTSYADAGVAAGVTYQYRIRASNVAGDSTYSNVAAVTTPAVIVRPATPTALAAYAVSGRQVNLYWQDNASNETLYMVQRSGNGQPWTTLGTVPANSTGAIDYGVVPGKTYYYRVFAYNAAGYSSASNVARAVTYYSAATPSAPAAAVPGGTLKVTRPADATQPTEAILMRPTGVRGQSSVVTDSRSTNAGVDRNAECDDALAAAFERLDDRPIFSSRMRMSADAIARLIAS